jgi:cell division protein FtsW
MLAVQSIVNFSVVTGMVPTKGLPLPFMSYGGSALLVNMTIIGILLRISRGDDVRPGVIGDRKLIERKLARRRIYASKGAAV